MSKPDAERAMDIYRNFTRQTDSVVQLLSSARMHQHHTRVEVPKLKHAPVNLGRQLEEYLKDPDFEIHRRQYMAEQDAKRFGGSTSKPKVDFPKVSASSPVANSNKPFPVAKKTETKPQAAKGPDPDLIDFFESIEQNQTPMQVNPQPTAAPFEIQPTGMPFGNNGFAPQPTGFQQNMFQHDASIFGQQQQQQQQQQQPFQQQQPQQQALQPNFTGAGFGGYTPQPSFQPSSGLGSIPQNSAANFPTQSFDQMQQQQQQQPMQPQPMQPTQTGTNPFRQSMMPQQPQLPSEPTPGIRRQSTNPFARSPPQTTSPFQPAPLQATPTGTNPFAKPVQSPPVAQQGIAPQPTGTTNPFRHGDYMNHDTGMGWQHNQMPMGGGLDNIQTVPVFPRPTQQAPWQ